MVVATSAECAADADWPRSPAEENEDEEREDLSSRFFGLSPNAVFFAFFFGGLAIMTGCFHLLAPRAYKDALSLAFQQLKSGDLRVLDVVGRTGSSELSEREALQQGRAPKSLKEKKRCVDSWTGCSGLSAEKCASDEVLRARCCRSCHDLTCVDTDENCFAWAMDDQCLDSEYLLLLLESACIILQEQASVWDHEFRTRWIVSRLRRSWLHASALLLFVLARLGRPVLNRPVVSSGCVQGRHHEDL